MQSFGIYFFFFFPLPLTKHVCVIPCSWFFKDIFYLAVSDLSCGMWGLCVASGSFVAVRGLLLVGGVQSARAQYFWCAGLAAPWHVGS